MKKYRLNQYYLEFPDMPKKDELCIDEPGWNMGVILNATLIENYNRFSDLYWQYQKYRIINFFAIKHFEETFHAQGEFKYLYMK